MKGADNTLLNAAFDFSSWLEKTGYASYDPYDLWGTRYGCWARQLYYTKGIPGVPFIAPVLLLEILAPSLRKLFVEKSRYATADGQLILAFLNLHRITGESDWLDMAITLGEELLEYSVPGFSGYCWGYPFDWRHSGGIYRKNTPFITATPYAYEAYTQLYEATNDNRYLVIAQSIAKFVAHDLNDTPVSENAAAGSYSPCDYGKVVNASAYRAMVLIDAGRRFNNSAYEKKGLGNLQFVLDSQREDGSWLYEILDDGGSSFIDNFHTCFNMKNLVKIANLIDRPDIEESLRNGFEYYQKELIGEDGLPNYYSVKPRIEIVRLEMYNVAEAITMGAVAREIVPESFEYALKLAHRLVKDYRTPQGHFITREYRGGIQHKTPFLRWPQSQLFYSITNLLWSTKEADNELRVETTYSR